MGAGSTGESRKPRNADLKVSIAGLFYEKAFWGISVLLRRRGEIDRVARAVVFTGLLALI